MNKHLLVSVVSFILISMTVFIGYILLDDIYFSCDNYFCNISQYENEKSCIVSIPSITYQCQQKDCKFDKNNSQCYMPKNELICPSNKCMSSTNKLNVISLIFTIILFIFLTTYCGYNIYYLCDICYQKENIYPYQNL